jgi:GntR family transcriptional regulator
VIIITIDPEQRRPIYLQIMDAVRRGRVRGLLAPGEALPTIRELAAELAVNPNTVRQAYRELEREGLVHVRRGQGTFVSTFVANSAERDALARTVAERAFLDAQRSGITPGELIDAMQRLATFSEKEAR